MTFSQQSCVAQYKWYVLNFLYHTHTSSVSLTYLERGCGPVLVVWGGRGNISCSDTGFTSMWKSSDNFTPCWASNRARVRKNGSSCNERDGGLIMRLSCDCHVIMLVQVFLVAVANTICGDLIFRISWKINILHLRTSKHTHIYIHLAAACTFVYYVFCSFVTLSCKSKLKVLQLDDKSETKLLLWWENTRPGVPTGCTLQRGRGRRRRVWRERT